MTVNAGMPAKPKEYSVAKVKPSVQEIMNTKQNLISLADEAMVIEREILAAGGELTPELERRFEFNLQQLSQKVDGYVFVEERLDAVAALWKRREEATRAVRKGYETAIERIRDRVKLVMTETQKTELAGKLHRYKLSTRAPKLVIEDESLIPTEMKMIIQTTTVDKQKVHSMLADGFEVPGARLEPVIALLIQENKEED